MDNLIMLAITAFSVIFGIFGYGRLERRKGRDEERIAQRHRDLAAAKRTREKLDAIDDDLPAIERLRAAGRLRDDD